MVAVHFTEAELKLVQKLLNRHYENITEGVLGVTQEEVGNTYDAIRSCKLPAALREYGIRLENPFFDMTETEYLKHQWFIDENYLARHRYS